MSSIISVKDLCLWYGNSQALKNISMNIDEHCITALIGPSGCGKTTLLNCVAGFQKYEGDILFKGNYVQNPSPERGVMFQEYGLFPWFTVQQNVEFGPKMKKCPVRNGKKLRKNILKWGIR